MTGNIRFSQHDVPNFFSRYKVFYFEAIRADRLADFSSCVRVTAPPAFCLVILGVLFSTLLFCGAVFGLTTFGSSFSSLIFKSADCRFDTRARRLLCISCANFGDMEGHLAAQPASSAERYPWSALAFGQKFSVLLVTVFYSKTGNFHFLHQ